jgi:hypothetical protein
MEACGAAGTERREEFTAYMTITDGQGPPKESTGGSSGPTASKYDINRHNILSKRPLCSMGDISTMNMNCQYI